MQKKITRCMSVLLMAFMYISSYAEIQLKDPVVADADNILSVKLSLTDKGGLSLDPQKLFFSVYRDNSTEPVVFETSTYQYIGSDMVEIPYGYTDSQTYDFWSNEGVNYIYYAWSGHTRLGAQAIYHDGDNEVKSAIVWSDGSSEEAGTGNPGTPDTPSDHIEGTLISAAEGELVNTVRTSTTFWSMGQGIYTGQDTGAMTNYVKGNDGNLYLLCVTGGNTTGNYIKLEPVADSRYVARLPQLVMVEEYDGVNYGFYASRLEKQYLEAYPDSISYAVSPDVANELSFTLEADGRLVMDIQDVDVMLGLTYSDGVWTRFGDVMISDVPVAGLINMLPDNADLQIWKMSYQWANWPEFGRMDKYLSVAIVGDEIYINNPYNSDPTQWIKGAIEGDKVSLMAGQLLGPDYEYNRYLYYRAGDLTRDAQGYYYSDADGIVFDYDADEKTLTTDKLVSIYISRGFGARGYNTNYDFPGFEAYRENIGDLKNPSFVQFAPDGTFDDYGYSYVQVEIPKTDVDGNELNTDNLYYSIYLNGDYSSPFVFKAEDYPMSLTQNMTEIPFNMDNYDFYPYAPGSEIHAFFTYFSTDDLDMGVQSVYYDMSGNVHKSEIIWRYTSAVENVISESSEDRQAPIYNLQGQEVKRLVPGAIYIRNGKKIVIR